MYILPCALLLVIQAQYYNAYCYIGDPASHGQSRRPVLTTWWLCLHLNLRKVRDLFLTPLDTEPYNILKAQLSASAPFSPALKLPSQFSVMHPQAFCLTRTARQSLLVLPQVWRTGSQMYLALLPVGKGQGQVLMATSTPVLPPSHLFYVTCRHSGLHFLVDTGAEMSILPVSYLSHPPPPTGHSLQAVNNSSIATFGAKSYNLNLGFRRSFQWVFLIADVQHAILGANILHHFKLLVNVTNHRLVDSITQLRVNCVLTLEPSPRPCVLRPPHTDPFMAILHEFPSLPTSQGCTHQTLRPAPHPHHRPTSSCPSPAPAP